MSAPRSQQSDDEKFEAIVSAIELEGYDRARPMCPHGCYATTPDIRKYTVFWLARDDEVTIKLACKACDRFMAEGPLSHFLELARKHGTLKP